MDSFEAGLVELLPRLRRFARSLARDSNDADDLVQLAIERGLRARDQWSAGTSLQSWMYRIMKNIWIDEARSRTRKSALFAPEEAGELVGADPRPQMDARMAAQDVARAMDRLPDEQRIVLSLVLVEGLSYREAADVLEVPMGTVTSRLVRGRQALVAQFEEVAA